MKTFKLLLGVGLIVCCLNANDILNDTQKSILNTKENKGKIEAELTKDSWVNPLTLEAKKDTMKSSNSKETIDSKALSLGFSQEIFKSGGILKTIKKGKLEEVLNTTLVDEEKKQLLSKLYGYVIELKKIDFQIEKSYYLQSSKKIEIEKNEASYKNGIIDITVLDESVIELSDLKNQKDNLNLQKIEILKEFKNYSDVDYKSIELGFLTKIDLSSFLQENTSIKIKKLEYKKSDLNKDIVNSNYLPKLSVYGSYGYENNEQYNKSDDSYNYGLKLSIPLDYNTNKNNQISKLDKLIAKDTFVQTKKDEENFYKFCMQKLHFIDNKIKNIDQTIRRYESLYKSVNSLYSASLKTIDDVHIMENRVASSKLDKYIFSLDKKAVLNQIYSKLK